MFRTETVRAVKGGRRATKKAVTRSKAEALTEALRCGMESVLFGYNSLRILPCHQYQVLVIT